jgi:hypothetical protein
MEEVVQVELALFEEVEEVGQAVFAAAEHCVFVKT